jgi:hypothetical protein
MDGHDNESCHHNDGNSSNKKKLKQKAKQKAKNNQNYRIQSLVEMDWSMLTGVFHPLQIPNREVTLDNSVHNKHYSLEKSFTNHATEVSQDTLFGALHVIHSIVTPSSLYKTPLKISKMLQLSRPDSMLADLNDAKLIHEINATEVELKSSEENDYLSPIYFLQSDKDESINITDDLYGLCLTVYASLCAALYYHHKISGTLPSARERMNHRDDSKQYDKKMIQRLRAGGKINITTATQFRIDDNRVISSLRRLADSCNVFGQYLLKCCFSLINSSSESTRGQQLNLHFRLALECFMAGIIIFEMVHDFKNAITIRCNVSSLMRFYATWTSSILPSSSSSSSSTDISINEDSDSNQKLLSQYTIAIFKSALYHCKIAIQMLKCVEMNSTVHGLYALVHQEQAQTLLNLGKCFSLLSYCFLMV